MQRGIDWNGLLPLVAAGFVASVLLTPAAADAQSVAEAVCGDTCRWANDGECDDGGPGSLYNICNYGSDCGDCGSRSPVAGFPPIAAAPPFGIPGAGSEPVGTCSNACSYAFDGECDDGGPGSLYDVCSLGTDCGDCGPRGGGPAGSLPVIPGHPVAIAPPSPGIPGVCEDTCSYAGDGECDDGGFGSLYNLCGLGTDCGDCGPRNPGISRITDASGRICENSCAYANDGECDDGGASSMNNLCGFGTDCGDCGPRG